MKKRKKRKEKTKNKGKNLPTSFERRTVLLHDSEELDDDLGGGADQDLALASLLGVVHGVERIVEDGSLDHFGGLEFEILKSRRWDMRYLCECRLSQPPVVFERKECPFAGVLQPVPGWEMRIIVTCCDRLKQ